MFWEKKMIYTDSSFFEWLMSMLRGLRDIRTPFFDGTMSVITLLGQEALFIVAAEIILYCINKKAGYKFLFMFYVGMLFNQVLKFIFKIPRPWMMDPDFEIVESARSGATGWSFPSGHTQSATMMYLGLAHELKKRWAYVAAALLILLIGFSRMYLGVHTLLDVSVAIILSLIVLILFELLFNKFGDRKGFITLIYGIATAVSLIFLIVVMRSDNTNELYYDDVKTAATIFGLAIGATLASWIEERYVKFEIEAVWWAQLIKIALGLGIVLGIKSGLKSLFALISDSPLMSAPRYFVMIFVAIAVYPLSFKVLNKLGRGKEHQKK